ncbi:MAG TPA: type I glyceraldehyde-3-phosphate dehydrogenase [Aggregatilineales bacterium]|jgi:glyceraldehyde 3-phosphate dehydrogenase|nr:type I glyceraldehyde-3-phosphate dehydrogenase [Aggregatilineales bacterium]
MAKIAINGMGRIGRAAFKILMKTPELELVAVNDIADPANIAYLLKYDTVYGRYNKTVELNGSDLVVGGETVRFFQERDPANLPWGDLGVDVVIESTGVFTTLDGLQKHVDAGAKWVILSAPAKDKDFPTVVHGVNTQQGVNIISCASCTTNATAPVMEIIDRHFGIEKAMMTTIHAYTSSQGIVDGPHKKWRRGRAGAANFVPTTTGAAVAATKALPHLEGKFDGIAVRGPVPSGSIADIVVLVNKPTTVEEINQVFRDEANDRYQGIVEATDDELVSSDILGNSHAAIIDLGMTQVVDGNMVKVLSWYDNEWGYTSQMVREALSLVRSQAVPS